MRPPLYPSITRLSVRPHEPAAVVGPRPRGSRRPHTDAAIAAVRRLIEDTALTYGEIAAKTGVGRASICRFTPDGQWQRPVFAPRATDTVPRARASAQLKRRTLAARLDALAERHIRELEESPSVDPDKLAEALELLKMAKLAARPRHGKETWEETWEETWTAAAPRRGRRRLTDVRHLPARRDEGPARRRRAGRARAGRGAGGFHCEPLAAAEAAFPARAGACVDAGAGAELGSDAAKLMREQERLGDEPISDKRLSEMAGVSNDVIKSHQKSDQSMSFALDTSLIAGKVLLRSKWDTGRRFELARLLGDRIANSTQSKLFPATRSYTYRQKLQRSFAAELLSPFDAVEDLLRGDYSPEKLQEAAAHFRVSELTIRTLLVNHGRIEREDLEDGLEKAVALAANF